MSAEAIVLCVPDKLVLVVGRREASVHCSMDFQIRLFENSHDMAIRLHPEGVV